VGHQRRTNPRTVTAYLAGEPPEVEQLDRRTRLWEMAMLGLRTTEGVDEQAVLPVLDAGAYKRLMAQGLLEKHCGKLRLNPGFLNVSNAIISELLVYPEP
jgi:coproporphyrinogen III oxidase-like Fe-S oxidoreductase